MFGGFVGGCLTFRRWGEWLLLVISFPLLVGLRLWRLVLCLGSLVRIVYCLGRGLIVLCGCVGGLLFVPL